jgi:hypothetical protein
MVVTLLVKMPPDTLSCCEEGKKAPGYLDLARPSYERYNLIRFTDSRGESIKVPSNLPATFVPGFISVRHRLWDGREMNVHPCSEARP